MEFLFELVYFLVALYFFNKFFVMSNDIKELSEEVEKLKRKLKDE